MVTLQGSEDDRLGRLFDLLKEYNAKETAASASPEDIERAWREADRIRKQYSHRRWLSQYGRAIAFHYGRGMSLPRLCEIYGERTVMNILTDSGDRS